MILNFFLINDAFKTNLEMDARDHFSAVKGKIISKRQIEDIEHQSSEEKKWLNIILIASIIISVVFAVVSCYCCIKNDRKNTGPVKMKKGQGTCPTVTDPGSEPLNESFTLSFKTKDKHSALTRNK